MMKEYDSRRILGNMEVQFGALSNRVDEQSRRTKADIKRLSAENAPRQSIQEHVGFLSGQLALQSLARTYGLAVQGATSKSIMKLHVREEHNLYLDALNHLLATYTAMSISYDDMAALLERVSSETGVDPDACHAGFKRGMAQARHWAIDNLNQLLDADHQLVNLTDMTGDTSPPGNPRAFTVPAVFKLG